MDPLLHGRTVVLVTHHVELVLPGAHFVIQMVDGRIATQGAVADLRAQGVLAAVIPEELGEAAEDRHATLVEQKTTEEVSSRHRYENEADKVANKQPRKLVQDEERQVGAVKWQIYKTYLRALSYWTWTFFAVFIACFQGFGLVEKIWIKIWGGAYDMPDNDTPNIAAKLPDASLHPLFYVGVFALIGFATILSRAAATVIQYTGALRASRVLFGEMLRTVVRATTRWHDVTPSGRILNR